MQQGVLVDSEILCEMTGESVGQGEINMQIGPLLQNLILLQGYGKWMRFRSDSCSPNAGSQQQMQHNSEMLRVGGYPGQSKSVTMWDDEERQQAKVAQ